MALVALAAPVVLAALVVLVVLRQRRSVMDAQGAPRAAGIVRGEVAAGKADGRDRVVLC